MKPTEPPDDHEPADEHEVPDEHGAPAGHEAGRLSQLKERSAEIRVEATERLDDAVHRFWPVALVVEAGRRWLGTNASILAGHLAFRFFLFLVPTALVVVSALGFASSGDTDIEGTASSSIRMSGPLARAIADTGSQAQGSRVQIGLAGVAGLIIAGVSLVTALRAVFAAVWNVSAKSQKRSKLLMLAELTGLVIILYLASVLRRYLTDAGLIFTAFGIGLMTIISGVFILGLSWMLPRRATRIAELLPGAAVGGIGLTLLNTGSAWYFTGMLESQSQTYGAIGITLTILTYLFFWGEVIVLSAVANAVWFDRETILDRTSDRSDDMHLG